MKKRTTIIKVYQPHKTCCGPEWNDRFLYCLYWLFLASVQRLGSGVVMPQVWHSSCRCQHDAYSSPGKTKRWRLLYLFLLYLKILYIQTSWRKMEWSTKACDSWYRWSSERRFFALDKLARGWSICVKHIATDCATAGQNFLNCKM